MRSNLESEAAIIIYSLARSHLSPNARLLQGGFFSFGPCQEGCKNEGTCVRTHTRVYVCGVCLALLPPNISFRLSCFADEEKVGPWPRGPIFPFRKKALQRLRVSKVKNPPSPVPTCPTLLSSTQGKEPTPCSHLPTS